MQYDAAMDGPIRRIAASIAAGVALVAALPGLVVADCSGPVCGEVDPTPDTRQVVILIVILVCFGTIMAIAEVRERRRRS